MTASAREPGALSSIISAAPQRRFAGLVLDGVDVNAAIAAATDARELEQAAQIAQRSRERIWGERRLLLSTALSIGAASALSSAAGAADILGKAPVQQQGAASGGPSSAFWVGGDFKENVAAGYLGGVYAVNGSLDVPGWLVRGQVTGVGFDFAMPPAPNGHGDFFRGDGAIGYQVFGYGLVAQGFVGVDYESTTSILLLPATRRCGIASGRSSWGAWRRRPRAIPFAIEGQFETGNSDFWVRGRTGVKFGQWTVGPEAIMLGNVAFDEPVSAASWRTTSARNMSVQANVGYADGIRNDNSGRGGSGVYGGMTFVFVH